MATWRCTPAITHCAGFGMRKHACAITKQAHKLVPESVLNHERMHQILSTPPPMGIYTAGTGKL